MNTINNPAATSTQDGNGSVTDKSVKKGKRRQRFISRRSFLRNSGAIVAGTVGGGFFINTKTARASGELTPGDAALLRFPAALEILEADFWIQYNELGGIQDSEVSGGTGIPAYTADLVKLDGDMPQYIHDNTDDEITHHNFLNAYLVSKGAAPANLDSFRTLMGSTADGVNTALIGKRLTDLTHLKLDTSWWTRYRDDSHNPDLDPTHVFPQAIPDLFTGQHTAIPRTNADLTEPLLQVIANTAAFHFPTIEQGGNSLYPSLAQRATSAETIRILISIGPTETMHFQTWADKAGNAPTATATDPVNMNTVTFDLSTFTGELLQTNLIMPEPCHFLSKSLPIVSIIRPTKTQGVAMGALKFLTDMGLFHLQSPAFFTYMKGLALAADAAQPENGQ
jgi:hypothetical protein